MKLLVHLHIYYNDQVDYFVDRLRHITDCEWDLVVTQHSKNEETEAKLKALKTNTTFLPVENVGYDIWPFIHVIRSIDITKYDLVMKLHTKNTDVSATNRINGNRLKGNQWRNLLVEPLLATPAQFRSVLQRFSFHPKTGIVFERALLKKPSKGLPEDLSMLDNELARLGVTTKSRKFCAGSMFIARAVAFRKLREHDISETMFSSGKSHFIGTYAHVYERILCILVADCGLECETLFTKKFYSIKAIVNNILTPALSFIFSIDRVGEQRRKRIQILGFNFTGKPE